MSSHLVVAVVWLVAAATWGCGGDQRGLQARGDGAVETGTDAGHGTDAGAGDDGPGDAGPRDTGPADAGSVVAACPAGAPVVSVCGCGCCGGQAMSTTCYYPSLGQSAAMIPDPRPADCSMVGCSFGVRHVCCADPGPASSGGSATYCAWSLPLDSIAFDVTRTDGATCTTLRISSSGASQWPVTVTPSPPALVVTGASRGPCGGSTANRTEAIGAVGEVTLTYAGTSSSITVHVALFFEDGAGVATSVRMDADRLPYASSACPTP